jgi:hypothetical protein
MKFLPVFGVVLLELGIGTVLFLCVQKWGEIRKSFFSFQCFLASACFFLMAFSFHGLRFFASPFFPSAILILLAGIQFSAERPRWGRYLALMGAALAGALFPLQPWVPSTVPKAILYLNVVAGILFFGWSNGAMVLGHWYLIMRGLSFSHFQKATTQMLIFLGLRTLLFAGVWIGMYAGWIAPWDARFSDPLLLSMRILWGLALPGIFGYMAWRCGQIGSNQAGTGLLYIAEVAVLIGELLAGFLGV